MKKLFLIFLLFASNLWAREIVRVRVYVTTVEERSKVAEVIHPDSITKDFIEAHISTDSLQELREKIEYPIEVMQIHYTGTKEFFDYLGSDNRTLLDKVNLPTIKRSIAIPLKGAALDLRPLLAGFGILNKNLVIENLPGHLSDAKVKGDQLILVGKDKGNGKLILKGKPTKGSEIEVILDIQVF